MEQNIENEKGIFIQGKGNVRNCSRLKKAMLKTKKWLKITK